ncbi:ubiquitin domain-containing protein 2-like [Brachyhypopomus gauderio]|uniref:ubiquitin domain-containing protein 2-like n=1 Tax=Brachyhypopomus gauderio TaxID=698409 RepID=UPI0040432DE3
MLERVGAAERRSAAHRARLVRAATSHMGSCLGGHHDSSGSLNGLSDGTGGPLGRSVRLRRDRPKWKSDYPMTDEQLRSKRDEFWDTAPAFDGRAEIWDALRASAHAFESGDHELAQAILDGAGVTLPHGVLSECYDELGNRYQLPLYCLSQPVNMIEERPECDPEDDLPDPERPDSQAEAGEAWPLRLRLSTGRDLRLDVCATDSVCHLKQRVQAQEGVAATAQRWFFSGRPLADKITLQELHIPSDYMVQVIVNQPPAPPAPPAPAPEHG